MPGFSNGMNVLPWLVRFPGEQFYYRIGQIDARNLEIGKELLFPNRMPRFATKPLHCQRCLEGWILTNLFTKPDSAMYLSLRIQIPSNIVFVLKSYLERVN
jgi:hypothetical protein